MRKRASSSSSGEPTFGVPFIDAENDGELPLDALDEFLVAGTDDKGRKSTVTCNIHPALDRFLDVLLLSKRFPYTSKRDLLRHAVIRHCAWLHDIRKSIPRHPLTMFEAANVMLVDDELAMNMEQVFIRLNTQVGEHVSRGEHQEAMRLVSGMNQKLKELGPSTWKRRFEERFYQTYGDWLRSSVKVKVENGKMQAQIEGGS